MHRQILPAIKKHLGIFFSFGAIQAAQILLPLLALPWLARILGPDAFGLLMYMCLIPPVVALLMDWGLMTGGARMAANCRENAASHGNLLRGVLAAKIILATAALVACFLAWPFVPHAATHPLGWFLAFCAGIARGSSPVWFFQGLGKGMRKMAVWDVAASLAVLLLSVAFIRQSEDWPLYLLFLALCKGLAYLYLVSGLVRKYPGKFKAKAGPRALWRTKTLFIGPLSTTICNSGTQLVMGYWLGAAQIGIISASHKMFRALAGIANPAAQTLFPETCRMASRDCEKAFILLFYSLGLTLALMSLAALLAWFAAPWLIQIALGSDYEQAVPILRAMLFAAPVMACNQMLASQGLLPFRLEKIQALAQGAAAIASLPLAALLASHYGIAGCAWLPLIIEMIVCQLLCYGLWKNRLKGLYRNQKQR